MTLLEDNGYRTKVGNVLNSYSVPGSLPGNLYAFLIYSSPKTSEVGALTDVETEAWRGLCSRSFSPRGAAAQVQSWCLTSEPMFILPTLPASLEPRERHMVM